MAGNKKRRAAPKADVEMKTDDVPNPPAAKLSSALLQLEEVDTEDSIQRKFDLLSPENNLPTKPLSQLHYQQTREKLLQSKPAPSESVLSRVRQFLPQLEQANQQLEQKLKTTGSAEQFDIEKVDPSGPYIEMNIGIIQDVADKDFIQHALNPPSSSDKPTIEMMCDNANDNDSDSDDSDSDESKSA
eukprot:TRINITY_DN5780_c0_g1::TRINITY_DN5780_c0_g1_i1::g.14561::m.14561 TRINITY_DN5780_c0_g1::TRINITY_DN5780_c0_g1_i1::g.14561  ORF type:complete len:187 (-),score=14.64,DUF4598/PF15370.1/8.2e+03,DUF4598/PF15370.1/1.3e-09 TRINITY_DN5780_c0_g1_i1:240-800(-)